MPSDTQTVDNENVIDTIPALCRDAGIDLTEQDGIMLVKTDAKGGITAHILRMGLLTEGRMEAGIMPIYMEINKARARIAQAARLKDRTNG